MGWREVPHAVSGDESLDRVLAGCSGPVGHPCQKRLSCVEGPRLERRKGIEDSSQGPRPSARPQIDLAEIVAPSPNGDKERWVLWRRVGAGPNSAYSCRVIPYLRGK